VKVSFNCPEQSRKRLGSEGVFVDLLVMKKREVFRKIRKKGFERIDEKRMSYLVVSRRFRFVGVFDGALEKLEKYEVAKKTLRRCMMILIFQIPKEFPLFKNPSSSISDVEYAAGSGQRALPLNALFSNTNDLYLWPNPSHPDRSSKEGVEGNQNPKNWLASNVCFDPRRSTMYTT
jgi:hypothetical protein